MPSCLFRDLLVTDWTFPFLPSPESHQLSPLEPALEPLESHPFVKVSFIGRIIGIGFPLDKPVSPNVRTGYFIEMD